MKLRVLLLALLSLLPLPGRAVVVVPTDVGYQGRVLDDAGDPLPGPIDVTIRIFDTPAAGTLLYTEQHLAVPLTDGIFHLQLGTGSSQSPVGGFGATLFSTANRWLEVAVGAETLTPRQAFSSVAYALRAERAEKAADADALGGTPASGWVKKGEAGAIGAGMLASGAVTAGSLADLSVVHTKIGQEAVLESNVGEAEITGYHVRDGTLLGGDLASQSITSAKIATGAVNATHLAAGSVGATQIAPGAVGSVQLANGGVGTGKLADASVTLAKVAPNAVDASRIVDGAVGSAELANDAVTSAKIAPLAIEAGALAASSVTTGAISNRSVTTPKLADGAVDGRVLADGSVSSLEITNNAVFGEKIADGGVSVAKLQSPLPITGLCAMVENPTTTAGPYLIGAYRFCALTSVDLRGDWSGFGDLSDVSCSVQRGADLKWYIEAGAGGSLTFDRIECCALCF